MFLQIGSHVFVCMDLNEFRLRVGDTGREKDVKSLVVLKSWSDQQTQAETMTSTVLGQAIGNTSLETTNELG